MSGKLLLLIWVGLFVFGSSFSQTEIKGKVMGQPDRQPIAFANIGILNSIVGTISNEDGSFTLTIPQRYSQDTVIFSALGYETKRFPLKDLVNNTNTIVLNEKVTILKEVVVNSKMQNKLTTTLGNNFKDMGIIYSKVDCAGAAIAIKIQSNSSPGLLSPLFVKNAQLWIYHNSMKEFKVRVRLYDIDSITGLPGNDLLNESVLITSRIRKGWAKVNLSDYNIAINDSQFFLAFEWIMDEKASMEAYERNALERSNQGKVAGDTVRIKTTMKMIKGVFFGSAKANVNSPNNSECYFRYSSFDHWEKSSSILTAQVTVTN